ncbi:MAG: Tad domain-containing protein [Acidimicrobiia bacterium]
MQRLKRDDGVAGVFVAITIATLLGMLGFAVDVGAMYDERRQLTNGADAAVLAIAEDCALKVSCNPGSAKKTAQSFANANANDGAAFIESVVLDVSARTVRVDTGTLTPSGERVFEPFFAQVIGWDGATVYGSASALWGYPSTMRGVLPLIISQCEITPLKFDELRVLTFHDANKTEPCNAAVGMDGNDDGKLAAGFGWLIADGADCSTATLTISDWVFADPGSSPSNGCSPPDISALIGEPTPLPIFDDLVGLGANGEYHIASFVLFEIAGYNFGGLYKFNPPCDGDERCVSGYFRTGTVHDGEPGGPNNGIVIVKLTG